MANILSARQQLLDFACEVSLFRITGKGYFGSLASQCARIARAAALEGVPINSPLTDLFFEQSAGHGAGENLGWHYRRAYRSMDSQLDPLRFFALSYDCGSVVIRSLGVANASGEITMNEDSVGEIFKCLRRGAPRSYHRWARDIHPVGGVPLLLRIDHGDENLGQLRVEAGDFFPCRGSIDLGEVAQECEQLAALIRLEPHVLAMFAQNRLTDDQRAAVAAKAAAIIARREGFCFFPQRGFCSACGRDVATDVDDLVGAAAATGCHHCGSTWCE